MPIPLERLWKRDAPAAAPAPESELVQWESRNKVQLPALLKAILCQRDGGELAHAELLILPVVDIVSHPYGDELTEDGNPAASAGKGKIFRFAENASGGQYLLNYNLAGKDGPAIYLHYAGMDVEMKKEADSLEDFLNRELHVEDKPGIDWSILADMKILMHDKQEIPLRHGGIRHLEIAFGNLQERWILVKEDRMNEEHEWTLSATSSAADLENITLSLHSSNERENCSLSVEHLGDHSVQHITWKLTADGGWKKSHESDSLFSFQCLGLSSARACLQRWLGVERAELVIEKWKQSKEGLRKSRDVFRTLNSLPENESKTLRQQWESLTKKVGSPMPSEAEIQSVEADAQTKERMLDYRRHVCTFSGIWPFGTP